MLINAQVEHVLSLILDAYKTLFQIAKFAIKVAVNAHNVQLIIIWKWINYHALNYA